MLYHARAQSFYLNIYSNNCHTPHFRPLLRKHSSGLYQHLIQKIKVCKQSIDYNTSRTTSSSEKKARYPLVKARGQSKYIFLI